MSAADEDGPDAGSAAEWEATEPASPAGPGLVERLERHLRRLARLGVLWALTLVMMVLNYVYFGGVVLGTGPYGGLLSQFAYTVSSLLTVTVALSAVIASILALVKWALR